MTHLFRPADPSPAPISPSWKSWGRTAGREARQLLARAAGLFLILGWRRVVGGVVVLAGLVVQVVLVLLAAYLTDLAVSLMELWAELARKHLELTM